MQVYFKSDEVRACIVTCGGLCPGLNTVIREIVCGLHHMYDVTRVLGIVVSMHFAISAELYLFHISYKRIYAQILLVNFWSGIAYKSWLFDKATSGKTKISLLRYA